MDMQRVPSERAWSHVGYSRAVRVGDVIEVAGTTASGPGGAIIAPGDMYGQAKYCIEVISKAIEELGGRVEDVVRTRVFLTDISLWEEAGRAHGEVFGEILPASAFVGVNELLHPDLMIEVEATAIVRERVLSE
jgi:enamine deaminase RidA (YjgF/YER057c/UK114 family)